MYYVNNELFETWSKDDQSMEERHARHWQRFIDLVEERDLAGLNVLDFGCNPDLAFSNAVVYLIEDMAHHAEVIKAMLAPGGVYYATHSEYEPGPALDAMRTKIDSYSPMRMQNHSLTDITVAFANAGFAVGVQLFRADGFVAIDLDQPGDPEVRERVRRAGAQKHIFRMTAPLE